MIYEPTVWGTVVHLIGEELATRFSAEMGGTRIYVPKLAGPNHPLSVVLGEKAAATLVGGLAGEFILVPMLLGRRARIVQLRETRMKIDEIAQAVGVSRRTVFHVLAEYAKTNPPQLDLFG